VAIVLNAGEVLEIAQQIERNGARFYREAARRALTPRARKALEDLADMEARHERTFASMLAALPPEARQESLYDPYDESVQYLRAVAAGQATEMTGDLEDALQGTRTIGDVLRKAIQMEKDSIVYYLGVVKVVPEDLGRDSVDEIIQEEMRHITLLTTMLEFPEGQT
jgi:rubrerythrin